MDAIDNRTDSGLRAEVATEEHNHSTLEKADSALQIAESDTNKMLENIQREQQQGVHATQPNLISQATAGPGAEWDAWKIMTIKKA